VANGDGKNGNGRKKVVLEGFVSANGKIPSLVLYWGETKEPLTFEERRTLFGRKAEILAATPEEVLLKVGGKKLVVVGITDPHAPPIPAPKTRR
jgi:hypothetical protein